MCSRVSTSIRCWPFWRRRRAWGGRFRPFLRGGAVRVSSVVVRDGEFCRPGWWRRGDGDATDRGCCGWALVLVELVLASAPVSRASDLVERVATAAMATRSRLWRGCVWFAGGDPARDLERRKVLPGTFIDKVLVARRRATQVALRNFGRRLSRGMGDASLSSSPATASAARCGGRP